MSYEILNSRRGISVPLETCSEYSQQFIYWKLTLSNAIFRRTKMVRELRDLSRVHLNRLENGLHLSKRVQERRNYSMDKKFAYFCCTPKAVLREGS